MAVFTIIMGIILVIAGFACIFTPFATFLATGYFLAALLMIYGFMGIARFATRRAGVLDLVICVLAIIAGIAALFYPGDTLIFDRMVLIFIGIWIILQGIVSIILAIQAKKIGTSWVFGLIVGILGIVAGILSFAHPYIAALTVGVLIGIYFVESGLSMIILGASASAAVDA